MILAVAPKVARLIPRLASDHDGEVIAVVAAIRRTLSAAGLDLHDLAAELQRPTSAAPHHAPRARRERAPTTAGERQAVEVLKRALSLDVLTEWEAEFSQSILNAAQRRDWHPTGKQSRVIDRLVRKARDAEAFTL